jgi:uncharacterized protein
MKRAIIVHCWEGYPKYCWYPYVKKELEVKGFQVEVPAFPETEKPELKKWLPKLKEVAGKADEDLYLIGHSVGCITIMRYLENLSGDEKIGGVVFVAGYSNINDPKLDFEELKNFFEAPVDLEKIKNKSKNGFIAIHSDNDPYVDLKYADIFREKLGAEIIIKHGMKHFSGAIEGEKACLELPDVVQSVEKLLE